VAALAAGSLTGRPSALAVWRSRLGLVVLGRLCQAHSLFFLAKFFALSSGRLASQDPLPVAGQHHFPTRGAAVAAATTRHLLKVAAAVAGGVPSNALQASISLLLVAAAVEAQARPIYDSTTVVVLHGLAAVKAVAGQILVVLVPFLMAVEPARVVAPNYLPRSRSAAICLAEVLVPAAAATYSEMG
jgi:hypothetical protein